MNDEIRATALRFLLSLGGFTTRSAVMWIEFNRAVKQVNVAGCHLMNSLVTLAPQRDYESEPRKAMTRFKSP